MKQNSQAKIDYQLKGEKMKEYFALTLKITEEEWEKLQPLIASDNYLGAEEIEENGMLIVKAYFKTREKIPPELLQMSKSQESIPEKNWNEEWKKYFKPETVSEKFIVIPSWMKEEYPIPKGKIPIYIYPGQTFGTGTHETTKLTIRFIEKAIKPGYSFLDVGAGSGILSIAAKKLGAEKTVACDIQKECKEEIPFNCKLNEVSGVEVFIGDLKKLNGTFDVVAANIEKHLLEPLVPEIYKKTKQFAVFSGILKKQRDDFAKTLKETGFTILEEAGEGEWMAFFCKK